jgi:sorbitol-specific phosphotransferase system component IIBC
MKDEELLSNEKLADEELDERQEEIKELYKKERKKQIISRVIEVVIVVVVIFFLATNDYVQTDLRIVKNEFVNSVSQVSRGSSLGDASHNFVRNIRTKVGEANDELDRQIK